VVALVEQQYFRALISYRLEILDIAEIRPVVAEYKQQMPVLVVSIRSRPRFVYYSPRAFGAYGNVNDPRRAYHPPASGHPAAG
jgi:hypothetical protein